MNTAILDKKIIELKDVEKQIQALSTLKDGLRTEVFKMVEEANGETYKNELATVSYVERKSVKIADEQKLIEELKAQNIVKYLEVVPEHTELKSSFMNDVKKGFFKHDLITVETSKSLAIRFEEEKK